MIRPLSNMVLLEPVPFKPSLELSIVVPDRYTPDIWEHRVIACGTAVPFDIQPGARVLIDPTLLNQREFEHEGRKVKLVKWTDIQMVIGVPNETP